MACWANTRQEEQIDQMNHQLRSHAVRSHFLPSVCKSSQPLPLPTLLLAFNSSNHMHLHLYTIAPSQRTIPFLLPLGRRRKNSTRTTLLGEARLDRAQFVHPLFALQLRPYKLHHRFWVQLEFVHDMAWWRR